MAGLGRRRIWWCGAVAVIAVVVMLLGGVGAQAASSAQQAALAYPYGSNAFQALISDSSEATQAAEAAQFPQWFEEAYAARPTPFREVQATTLPEVLAKERSLLEGTPQAAVRAKRQADLAADLHKLVKALIPRFSLTRGFEFAYTVKYGERQCLLQSTLVAALLQQAGVPAGVVMVFRNGRKAKSNISHVATLVKLSDGTDRIVDCSYDVPFVTHTGILVSAPRYRFVRPHYAPGYRITCYSDERTGRSLPVASISPLDYRYVRSQFWYYRGERASGGILAAQPSKGGLATSRRDFLRSLEYCPGNPIAAYMLGRTYRAEGNRGQAARLLTRARDLYASYGWLPEGPTQAAAAARK